MESIMHDLTYINYLVYTIVFILSIYYIFNESKKIGIMKMHGISSLQVWFLLIGRLILILFVCSTLIALPAALCIKDTSLQFVGCITINQLRAYAILMALSLVAYLYISRIKVGNALKNRRDTDGIFAFNTLLKVVCTVLLVLTCLVVWDQYQYIQTKQENLQHWVHSKDYGVFYPLIAEEEEVKNGRLFGTIHDELYNYLNQRGALLIGAGMYEEEWIRANQGNSGIRWSISVNPNYLREFPVYDAQQQPVQVSEDCTDWTLLMPEKYKGQEKEISSYFQKERSGEKNYEGKYQYEERRYKRTVPDRVRNQQIKIVWLANQQKIFSFDPEVFPSENNVIVDPIIQVVTEQNSLLTDRDSILGGGAKDPLKIKLVNRDTVETYQSLLPELQKLQLDNNLPYLVSSNQLVLQEIYRLQETEGQLAAVALGLLTGLLLLVFQNLVIFFNKYQYRFIVCRLFGIGFFRTYKEYLWLFSALWALQIIIASVARWIINTSTITPYEVFPKTFDLTLALTIAGLFAFELAASVIALGFIERRNRVKILKGGA